MTSARCGPRSADEVSPCGSPVGAWSRRSGSAGTGCLAWLQNNRRLVRRYERKADHFQAFADLGCALLGYRRLTKNNNLG
ncbi:hypothetical protein [Polymorphospora rubra]|uniref:hypothetical protein n=1 Tax=Polymorphospora rubra TaxID=338584 RepID=UPI0033EABC93